MTYWYDHDYPNDTKLHFTRTDDKAEIKLEFTSEDDDIGTETLTLVGDPSCSLLDLCKEQHETITEYLDKTENGIRRNIEGYRELRDLTNSTLYAFENMLTHLINDIEGRKEKKMEENRSFFPDNTKVQLNRNWNLMNIDTGNLIQFEKGTVGTTDKINWRKGTMASTDPRYLIRFDYKIDDDSGAPVSAWVDSMYLEEYHPKKWYMRINDASKMIAKRMIDDRNVVFAFCESDSEEAKGDPEKHRDEGGWHGIKRIPGFFDNEPDEFIVAVGHYGGGDVGFGYDYGYPGDYTYAEVAVRKAICDATGWDADNMIYIEEEEKKEEK